MRIKKLKCGVFLILCGACAREAYGGPPKIHKAIVAPSKKQIWVEFETPVPLTDCDVVYPNSSNPQCKPALQNAPWEIVAYDQSGAANPIRVTASRIILGSLAAHGDIELDLEKELSLDFSRLDVTFTNEKGGSLPHFAIEKATKPSAKWISSAKTKDDSNVYISGTFAPASGSSPTYTIDSKGSYILHSFAKGAYTVSATGDINTDKKKTADPDSFHWAIPVQHVSTANYTVQFPTIGMELDKKGNAANLVSAPNITYGLGHAFLTQDTKTPCASQDKNLCPKTVSASVGLDLSGGVEFGSNLINDYAVANKTLGGQGWFFRGVPSASAYLIIPKVLHLSKISITSSYTARIPTTNEVFIETRHTPKPFPELTDRTRNYVQNAINFMVTDYVGIQIKHQYGSLPPAFSFVQNSGSIGLVFALKESRVPQ